MIFLKKQKIKLRYFIKIIFRFLKKTYFSLNFFSIETEFLRERLNISVFTWFLITRLVKFFLIIFISLNLVIFIINFNKLSFKLEDLGFSIGKIFKFCLLLVPLFSFQILPFAAFFSSFFCIYLMFLANEILSFYAIGYFFRQILKRCIYFSFCIFFLAIFLQFVFPFFFSLYGQSRKVDISIMIKNLKPRVLNKLNENVLINFDKIDTKGNMKNVYVFITNKDNVKTFLSKKAHFARENSLKLILEEAHYFNINKIKKNYHYHLAQEAKLDMDFFGKGIGDKGNFNNENLKLKRIDILISEYLKLRKEKKKENLKPEDFNFKKNNYLEEINRRILIPFEVLSLLFFNFFNLFKLKSPRLEGGKRALYSFVFFAINILTINFLLSFLIKKDIWLICYLFYFLFFAFFYKKLKNTCI